MDQSQPSSENPSLHTPIIYVALALEGFMFSTRKTDFHLQSFLWSKLVQTDAEETAFSHTPFPSSVSPILPQSW